MGAKGSVEAAKMNADNWGHLEVCIFHVVYNLQFSLFRTLPLSLFFIVTDIKMSMHYFALLNTQK